MDKDPNMRPSERDANPEKLPKRGVIFQRIRDLDLTSPTSSFVGGGLIGGAVGGILLGPLGAVPGVLAGALAGQALDKKLDQPRQRRKLNLFELDNFKLTF